MTASNKSQMSDDQYFLRYDDLINECISRSHVPGVSIAVVDGYATWSKGYGFARRPNESTVTDTLFDVGSMTKVFVAAAISLLVDDEKYPQVQWNAPVSSILKDDFVLADDRYTEMVTVEDILSHRSGLSDQDDACFGIYAKTPDTPKSVTRKLRYLPISHPLRTKYDYCNMMYVAAVHMIETLTGSSMVEFLHQRVWNLLGMNNSYFGQDDLIAQGDINRFAKGYQWMDEKSAYIDVPWPKQPEAAGAGEMISTASDYIKFVRSLIQKSGPISEKGHEELVKPRTITNWDPDQPFHSQELYALGLSIEHYHGELVIGHDGSTTGFGSKMLYLPRLKWGIVVLGNTGDASDAHEQICWSMIDDLLDVPQDKRFDWTKKGDEEEKDEKVDLYPNLPDPPIPTTLPLSEYTGAYSHDGYGTLAVELKEDKLWIDATDRTWRITFSFEHASGEYFIMTRKDVATIETEEMKAEFRLDSSGRVAQLGVDFVPELNGELIWFLKDIVQELL